MHADDTTTISSRTSIEGVGRRAQQAADVVTACAARLKNVLPDRAPPWEVAACPHVSFNLSIGAPRQQDTSAEAARRAAQRHLASLPQRATWVWTDGSADGGVRNGGAGAYIEWPDGTTTELRSPAGRLCSSFRAELTALLSALQHLLDHPAHTQLPVVICTDSQSALAALREGPTGQKTPLGASVWGALASLAGPPAAFTCSGCRPTVGWTATSAPTLSPRRRRRSSKRASRWTSGLPTARR